MSKDKILSLYHPNDIYLRFLGLNEFPNRNISSPFSEDENPSFRLYTNGTFKCFSTGKQGDIFSFVAELNHLDCKKDFSQVLELISTELGINLEEKTENSPLKNKEITFQASENEPQEETKNTYFSYQTKSFDFLHYSYFMQGNWNVTLEILEKYKVKALDSFEFWSEEKKEIQKFKIFSGVIGFAYELGSSAELYIPKQQKNKKFFLNKTSKEDIYGFEQLPKKTEQLIICAGKKDCLILNANGFEAVTFRSENHTITPKQLALLKKRTTKLLICYDNDRAGKEATKRVLKEHSDILSITLPKFANDIADYFLSATKEDFRTILLEAIEVQQHQKETYPDNQTIYHMVEKYLNEHYKFRFNTISIDIEYRKKGSSEWKTVNEHDLYIELRKRSFKVSMNDLISILESDFVPIYNPLEEYFHSLPKWDQKTDYIAQLASYVQAIDKEQFTYHFKKWAVRAVKCVLEEGYFNKQCFVLVQKGQNTGKSTFCRFLSPPELKDYISENISTEKDGRIAPCKNFLINIDELATLSKYEVKSLKALFSYTQVNERLPYDKKSSVLTRTSSFIGSTNESTFLVDETGSVRWLCFQIIGINWEYKKEFNIRNFWSQAYSLATSDFDCELSAEDTEKNEKRNQKFQQTSLEQELISKYIEKSNEIQGEFCTASDITLHINGLGMKVNHIQVGRALSALEFERTMHSKKKTYGYYVKKLSLY